MRNCCQCNYQFAFINRLKATLNLKGYLECPQCKSVFKPTLNIYRGIYYFLVTFIYLRLFNYIVFNNPILKSILFIFIIATTLFLFELLPHRWHKYKKIN
jgi:CXXC-20-CXXC protein